MTTVSFDTRIVRASLEHLDSLVPLFDAYRQFYGQPSNPEAAWQFLVERFENGESIIFIALSNRPGNPAQGFVQLYPTFSSVSLKRLWILNDLFVHPDARHKGIARKLIEQAKQWAQRTNAKGLTLSTGVDNAAAQALYESCGWKRDEQFHRYYINL